MLMMMMTLTVIGDCGGEAGDGGERKIKLMATMAMIDIKIIMLFMMAMS